MHWHLPRKTTTPLSPPLFTHLAGMSWQHVTARIWAAIRELFQAAVWAGRQPPGALEDPLGFTSRCGDPRLGAAAASAATDGDRISSCDIFGV